MRITINDRYFRFNEKSLAALNAVLKSADVMPIQSSYNYKTAEYDYVDSPDAKRTLNAVSTLEWK